MACGVIPRFGHVLAFYHVSGCHSQLFNRCSISKDILCCWKNYEHYLKKNVRGIVYISERIYLCVVIENNTTMIKQFSKTEDLKSRIGQTFCNNRSSTLRSVLINVVDVNGKTVCLTKEAVSPYNKLKPKTNVKSYPVDYIYTCFVGV